MPEMPVRMPVVEMSQSDESRAIVAELFPSVVTPVEDNVVNDPVPGVTAPIEAKLAAPAPVIFQLASFRARSVFVVRPMVIVPVDVPVPMLVASDPEPLIVVAPRIVDVPVSASVSSADPILMVSALVLLVPTLIVFPLVPVPMFTVPVVVESRVRAPVVPDVIARFVAAPDDNVPVPANPRSVAVVEIVLSDGTPVRAPAVVTFNPPFDVRVKVPVALPMATAPVLVLARFKVPVPFGVRERLALPDGVPIVAALPPPRLRVVVDPRPRVDAVVRVASELAVNVVVPLRVTVVAPNLIDPSTSLSIVSAFCNTKSFVMVESAMFIAFVIPPAIPPEFEILSASVMTVDPVALVSALSSLSSADTALSVAFVVTWFCICAAYSVLLATVGLFVKARFSPV